MKKKHEKIEMKSTKLDILKLILILVIIFFGFYFFINYQKKKYEKELEFINSNYSSVKAKIVNRSTYKSNTLTVVYQVNGVNYKESKVVNSNDIKIGDSIMIKYSNLNPELIIIDIE